MQWNNFIPIFIICSILPITIFCQKKDIDSFRIVLVAEKEETDHEKADDYQLDTQFCRRSKTRFD